MFAVRRRPVWLLTPDAAPRRAFEAGARGVNERLVGGFPRGQ
jgi:hypothetical protein